jgi:putative DNA primase/helicase
MDNESSTPRLLSVKQFSALHPAFSPGSIRWMIYRTSQNHDGKYGELPLGLAEAFIRFGTKVLIDEIKFFEAIQLDDRLHSVASLIKSQLQPFILGKRFMDLEEINSLSVMEAAGRYAEFGLQTIAVHGMTAAGQCTCGAKACSSPGKHPIQKNWNQEPLLTTQDISEFWGKWPEANIGLLTGPGSGLLVLDIDSKDGHPAEAVLAAVQQKLGQLPSTPMCRTGSGGFHLFFQYPKDHKIGNSVGKLAKQVDIRGEGGFVVAAPSRHISGEKYKWIS